MPQFEKTTFFSQIFYFCAVFSAFYFITNNKYIHVFLFFKKITEKKRKYHSELKTSTLNTVNEFKTLTTNFFDLIVTQIAYNSEKTGSIFLDFLKNKGLLSVVALNKGFVTENVSKTEQSLNQDLPKVLKTAKVSNIQFNLQGYENLNNIFENSKKGNKASTVKSRKVNFQLNS